MFLMQFDTAHHSFQAIGLTKEALATQLLVYWEQHAKDTGADPLYARACLAAGGVDFIPMALNTVICDGQSEAGPARFPITCATLDDNATPTGDEHTLMLGIDSLSDIVSHAVQMAVADHRYRHNWINEREFDTVRHEFLDALDASGALDVDKLQSIGTAPW